MLDCKGMDALIWNRTDVFNNDTSLFAQGAVIDMISNATVFEETPEDYNESKKKVETK